MTKYWAHTVKPTDLKYNRTHIFNLIKVQIWKLKWAWHILFLTQLFLFPLKQYTRWLVAQNHLLMLAQSKIEVGMDAFANSWLNKQHIKKNLFAFFLFSSFSSSFLFYYNKLPLVRFTFVKKKHSQWRKRKGKKNVARVRHISID